MRQDEECGCSDLNECTSHTDECHHQAACTNTIGSHICECPPHLIGDGLRASFINFPNFINRFTKFFASSKKQIFWTLSLETVVDVKKMNAQNALKEVPVPLKILANVTKVQLEPGYHALKQTLSYRCRKEFQNKNSHKLREIWLDFRN